MEKARKYFISALRSAMDIVFPPVCASCGGNADREEGVCDRCFSAIPLNDSLFCGECGARLPCGEKICHTDFPCVVGAAAPYRDATVGTLVRDLKFGFVRDSAKPLARLLVAYWEKIPYGAENWTVVPVPLGSKRMRERGFNQAELIAKIFADNFSFDMCAGAISRTKETEPQSEMGNFAARRANTKECFSAAGAEILRGKNIIIVDDVSTSGATFREAASALKKAGAKRIIALAAAKG